jgi:hypothetical protein
MLTIAVDDRTFINDLCWHYTRSGFVVDRLACGAVHVSLPDAPSTEQSWREAALHLFVWRAMNPAVSTVERRSVRQPQDDDVATER